MASGQDAARREVARMMLEALRETNFVLTGGSALIEHGLTHRVTKDVDLFTTGEEGQCIPDVLPALRRHLASHGADLSVDREFPGFVDGRILWGGHEIGFDLGADWRGYPAARMEIGPVLDVRDSVGSKIAALYSRFEVRDYLDAAAIMLDGRWSAQQIIAMGQSNDPGLEGPQLATILTPGHPNFPDSEDYREAGFDTETETRMREALAELRRIALGESTSHP
ncbi:nucleotidyl transferase AbiEii/AbiGii toxin family protein [Brachybacterium sp. UMB0905]|uniref:nucleotidyl transferase AbiEii/AbiGii toxin family protein n=1 Tax=Brachybacterium sp. UMB0905 TaxID=2069310 RepID=UPI000C805AE7|nr:nucleotidyl transferase AbiEii/AbiGii toxin family protein [Brachybacterium sp. UMB0905]PMC75137.1 hypothetical protein CJ197_09025 [Brachybacterium sp. UMB0905]